MHPKRLIEIDLPIRRISTHARREKSIRHGHISTLHIWWARRPLAACRAVLCAALWIDPADPLCPSNFIEKAKAEMLDWAKNRLLLLSKESAPNFNRLNNRPALADDPVFLRERLLDFIADFANWDNASQPDYLHTARTLTQCAHEALGGEPGSRPLVADPFAGGGSIPLEALRIGADAFASDLNPIPVLINKVQLEYIPRYGKQLAEEVRRWGLWIKEQAEAELTRFYPPLPNPQVGQYTPSPDPVQLRGGKHWTLKRIVKETPIAYLWARTVRCEGPNCGAEIPLMRSRWLAKTKNRQIGVQFVILERPAQSQPPAVDFQIIDRKAFQTDNPDLPLPKFDTGTVQRGTATCPCCGFPTPVASVRRQLKARSGGANDARLYAVVTTLTTEREYRSGTTVLTEEVEERGRFYRLVAPSDLEAVRAAEVELERREAAHEGKLSLIPDESTPDEKGHRAVGSIRIYGLESWADLFLKRQSVVLAEFGKQIRNLSSQDVGTPELKKAIAALLSVVQSRQANTLTSLSRWHLTGEKLEGVFSRQTLPIVWDFCEGNPFSSSTGNYEGALDWVVEVCKNNFLSSNQGQSLQANAIEHPLPNDATNCFFTDPPYYDSVPYADLSDFFYVWLKRNLNGHFPEIFTPILTPKLEQAVVWHPGSLEEKQEYERKMFLAMEEGRRVLMPSGIGMVVFAHKSTSGWESQLNSMVDAGWIITASWAIDTEMETRVNAQGTASLATSIHLICRPRENPDGSLRTHDIGDWREVLRELPLRIREWMPRLAAEGVVGADAIFACLGPALEIFSRHHAVEKPDGTPVPLREYLEHVWAAVSREALRMVFDDADTQGFEEDARVTAIWLWTLSGKAPENGAALLVEEDDEEDDDTASGKGKSAKLGGFALDSDTANRIAQGLGANIKALSTVVEVKGENSRLLPVSERAKFLFAGGSVQPTVSRKSKAMPQLTLFSGTSDDLAQDAAALAELKLEKTGKTVLDRLHQAMLLFSTGRTEALKRYLTEGGAGSDNRFWTLAQALNALYPKESEERRWVEGVQTYKKPLGF